MMAFHVNLLPANPKYADKQARANCRIRSDAKERSVVTLFTTKLAILDMLTGKMDLFKFKDKYGKE